MTTPAYHYPALLDECITALNISPDSIIVDATFGGGGHSRGIIKHLGDDGHLYGFDQDMDAYQNRIDDPKFTFVHGNFAFITNFLRYYGNPVVDGILADLGVSFHHFDDPTRGFSFRFEGPLDMRMNKNSALSAQHIVNDYTEEQLTTLFRLYGDLPKAHLFARAIAKARAKAPITTTEQLCSIVQPLIKPDKEKKELAQVFQAIRIEVNHEIDALKALLQQSIKVLRPGGRIAIITYHSIEDKLVKNFFRAGNIEGNIEKDFFGRVNAPFKLINSKVITPSDEEVERNPRARSAKLRIAEKL